LVLDNMEQVLEAGPDVAALLACSPGLTVLATSRGALRLSGERQYPVPALRLPASGESQLFEDVASAAAVVLFAERARMAKPGFTLSEANAPAVVEICRRLDGLPLAIELAAARIPLLPPAALAARMERRLPLLTGGSRDLPERLQTMRAAIAWSYDLLSPEEQSAFRRLAVFDGGFTLEAAEVVMTPDAENMDNSAPSASPIDCLAALVEQGLVWQDEQPDGDARFGMLETIREYGLERLQASGEEEAVRQSHAAWFLALTEGYDTGSISARFALLNRMERELANFRVALAWTEQAVDTEIGLRLATALTGFWHVRSHRSEGRGWLERALARDSSMPSEVHVGALITLGLFEHSLGNPELGALYMNQALELARVVDARRGIVLAQLWLAEFAVDGGENERAARLMARAEEWGDAPDDPVDVPGTVLKNRGILARRRGDLQQSRTYFTDALARFGYCGDVFSHAIAAELLGLVHCDCSEHELAARYFRESLEDWRAVGTRESLIDWLAMVATLAAAAGELSRSSRWFGAVEAQAEIYGFNFPLPERVEFDRTAESVRTGPADPDWIAGRELSLDQVTEEAAGWLEEMATLARSLPQSF
jgi:predicted ATPase